MNNNKNNNKNNNDIRKENLSNPPERYVESVRRFLNYDRNCGSGMQGLTMKSFRSEQYHSVFNSLLNRQPMWVF